MQIELIYYPNDILNEACDQSPIQPTKERAEIASKMWKIMQDNKGVGLAANQVGLDYRMFVWMEREYPQAIWNPKLKCVSGRNVAKEGCLSLPGISVSIERPSACVLEGQGINGLRLKFVGDETLTRVWQHEIDHLNGILIIDNMNKADTISNSTAIDSLQNKSVALKNQETK